MEYLNQHWIPKSYTKGWADPDGPKNGGKRVHIYSSTGEYKGWRYPPGVFALPDLYTRRGSDGLRDVSVEKALSKIEHQYEAIKSSLLRKKEFGAIEKGLVAAFAAAMHQRSPVMRDHHRDAMMQVVALGESMREGLARASPAQRDKMIQASSRSLSKGPSVALDDFKALAEADFGYLLPNRIFIEAKELSKLNMAVLHTVHPVGFITSDCPVVWWAADENGLPLKRPLGLRHLDIEVSMPISPRAIAFFSHEEMPPHIDLDEENRAEMNMRVHHECYDVFIANCGTLSGPKLD